MRRWIQELPLWALPFVYFVVVLVIRVAVSLLLPEGHPRGIGVEVVGDVFFAAVMAVVFTAFTARQRRRAGGARNISAMAAATKTGDIPLDADPGVWVPMLERWRGQWRRARWATPIVFGVIGLLALALGLFDGDPVPGIGAAVFFAAAIAWNAWTIHTRLPNVERMLAEFHRREGRWPERTPDQGQPWSGPEAGTPVP